MRRSRHLLYEVFRNGADKQASTLYDALGLGGNDDADGNGATEARNAQRTQRDLRLAFVREARKLRALPSASAGRGAPTAVADEQERERRMTRLVEAYRRLSSDRFRAAYHAQPVASPDAQLHVLLDGGPEAALHNPHHAALDFGVAAIGVAANGARRSFGDFSGAFASATGKADAGPTAGLRTSSLEPVKGADINFTLRLTFAEAVAGCSRQVAYRRACRCRRCRGTGRHDGPPRRCVQCGGRGRVRLPSATYTIENPCAHCGGDGTTPPPRCPTCRGGGVVSRDETLTVDIAPGAHTQAPQRVRGRGDDGLRGGASGDLVLSLLVEEHRVFHRVGRDLHVALPIPLSTALLGGVVDVPTLAPGSPRQLRVPAGVSHGQILTLDGAGVPADPNAGDGSPDAIAGHIRVHAVVVIPRADQLTGAQRRVVAEFSDVPAAATFEALKHEHGYWFDK